MIKWLQTHINKDRKIQIRLHDNCVFVDICYSNILNVGNKDKYFNNIHCQWQFTSKQNWIALGGPTPTGLLGELFCSTSATPLVSVGHKKYQKHWYMLYHLQRLVSTADSSAIHAVYIPRQLVFREVSGFSKKN